MATSNDEPVKSSTKVGNQHQKNKGGRPIKISAQKIEQLVGALRLGYFQEDAAKAVGISPATYFNWRKRGKEAFELREQGKTVPKSEEMFLELFDVTEKARAEILGYYLSINRQQAQEGNLRAVHWFLEKSFPDKYGNRVALDVGLQDNNEIEVEIKFSD
jgi:transposase